MNLPDYDTDIALMIESGEVPVRPDPTLVGADAWITWYDAHVRCKHAGCYLPHLPCIAYCAQHRDENRAQAKVSSFSFPTLKKPRAGFSVVKPVEGVQRKPRTF